MSKLKTVNIKGKDYVEVNERLKYFREKYPAWSLITYVERLDMEKGYIVMKACIYNEQNQLIATGYAYEKESSSFINKTSFIENCETSAWGRALGNLGIGIDSSVATAEEVQNAINNQPTTKKSVELTQDDKDLIYALSQSSTMEELKTSWSEYRKLMSCDYARKQLDKTKDEVKEKING